MVLTYQTLLAQKDYADIQINTEQLRIMTLDMIVPTASIQLKTIYENQ